MDYTRFKALSSSLIAEYGGEVTFIHKQLDTSRPQPGGYPTITVETPVKALRTNPTMQELQAGAVQLGDVLLLVSGADLEKPDSNDTVVLDGKEWGVKHIVNVAPSGDDILYKIQIRVA